MKKTDGLSSIGFWQAFLKGSSGVTAIEYGLIMGLIAVAIIAVLTSIGGGIENIFNTIGNAVSNT